ncbi:type I polyketide synthase [Chondromyces crocatus]|uniref:Polyketide synthase n=1 Tax=Chondromyces crocatus TaxID=52 RepID=B1GYF7_CHOCO|nr:type I polyketide synthase [Chondromyces crocatus]AKT41311.1 polyketide synthase [Chondromyces crocatus]CAQ18830.1 polyketide synthase [Chondromyces crocatus]
MSNSTETPDPQARLREAILAIHKLRTRLDAVERQKTEPIAIIGVGCRFPGGASTPDRFWSLLRDGVDAVVEVPAARWDADTWYDPTPGAPGKMYVREGGFLEGAVDAFDADFFGISPREAAAMDPQQRLLLEVAREALEHAGEVPEKLARSATGVFVGVMGNDYSRLQMRNGDPRRIGPYTGTGYAWSFLAGRVSYLLGLQGPSMVVDTACSSSLAAVHLACSSLRAGECDLALAGGVNLILAPESSVVMCQLQALAKDGRCKTFDAAADGYGRGEGAGVIVLKRLGAALAAGDRVLAVIRGSAVGHDGPSGGLTIPNGAAQQDVIRRALANGKVAPSQVSYVEAHGTGTSLGDPIELRALWSVLGEGRAPERRLRVGSVKTNFGHLEGAAGISGLIKVVLALKHQQIPPHLHLKKLNSYIAWDEMPVDIPQSLSSWEVPEGVSRIGGVSSFGLSGINAHVVLEEAPAQAVPTDETTVGPVLLPLSARSEGALRELAQAYVPVLSGEGPSPKDIAATTALRRAHHEHRLALVGATLAELREQVEAFLAGEARVGMSSGVVPAGVCRKVVFVYPGQGSQWVGMGRELLESEPVFREAMDRCEAAMKPWVSWSLSGVLRGDGAEFDRVDVVQPVLFALAAAMTALWRSWGVEPDAVVGHSQGEIAAAYAAGALTLEDASRIVCERSRLVATAGGNAGCGKYGMGVVELSWQEAEARLSGLEGRVAVAAHNGPRSTVLSGETEALDTLMARLNEEGRFCRRVKVDYASHSPQMDALEPELLHMLQGITPRAESTTFYSTVTGEPRCGAELDPTYWAQNIRRTVRFTETVERLSRDGYEVFLEISPHPLLTMEVEASVGESGRVLALPSLRRGEPERASMLGALGAFHTAGYPVNFERLCSRGGRFVDLPTYPWQRQPYWLEDDGGDGWAGAAPPGARQNATSRHPLLGDVLHASLEGGSHFWERDLATDRLPLLGDHRVQGAVVMPAAAYLEMALAAAAEALDGATPVVEGVAFHKALFVPESGARRLQVVVTPELGATASFQIASAPPGEQAWTIHATGSVRLDGGSAQARGHADLAAIRARCTERVSGAEHYETARARGLDYGPSFQGVTEIARRDGEALAAIHGPEVIATEAVAYGIHPALLDACFQAASAAAPRAVDGDQAWLPVHLDRFRLVARPSPNGALFSHAVVHPATGDEGFIADVEVLDAEGKLVAEARGFRAKPLEQLGGDPIGSWLFSLRWERRENSPAPMSRGTGRSAAERGAWLVFDEGQGIGCALTARLEERHERVVTVTPGTTGEGLAREAEDRYRLDPAFSQGFRNLLAEAFQGMSPAGVLFAWSLGAPPSDDTGLTWLHRAEELGPVSALHLVQGIAEAGWSVAPRLWLVTRGAVPIGDGRVVPAMATMWGLARTLAYEHPELRCTAIDLDSTGGAQEIPTLLAEFEAADPEDQVALRGGERFVARLARTQTTMDGNPSAPSAIRAEVGQVSFRLEIDAPGVLDNLVLRESVRQPPGPDEVEIEVRAAGLNFLDVLSAMGMRPDVEPGGVPRLGGECAGTVTAVGERVDFLQPGDAVIALAPHSMGSHVTTAATFVVRLPANLGFEEAAGIPIAFMTAYHAVCRLGQLGPGERVLIHAASGGTGLAAVQLARRCGAEIFATAGSEEKRALLRAQGIEHVMDSRSTSFADEILRATGGKGVDVVLNSLTGEAIPRSLAVLAPYGRFLEIGKRDIYENRRLGLAPFQRNLSYFAVDLARMLVERPERCGALLREVVGLFASGELSPPPTSPTPIAEAAEAFRRMAQAKHVGKIVLLCNDPGPVAPLRRGQLRPDGTYLVTGGLGGLGLALAEWLVGEGARHLVLVGRNAPSPTAHEVIRRLETAGARVFAGRADVADRVALADLLAEVRRTSPPLRGIFHAAAVLDDGIALELDRARVRRVMAPKVDGAWNLHSLTQDDPLDLFVLFSSVASVLGSPGQSNYAAANAFLDALAHERRAMGLPAQSFDWGPWAEVGLAAQQDNRGARLEAEGMGSISPRLGLEALRRLLHEDPVQPVIVPLNLERWRESQPGIANRPLLSALLAATVAQTPRERSEGSLRQELRKMHVDERSARMEVHLREQVARTLRASPTQIRSDLPLHRMGVDSLMAMELKKRIEAELGVTVPVVKLLKGPSLAELAGQLLELVAAEEVLDAVITSGTQGGALGSEALGDAESVAPSEDEEIEVLQF